MDAMTDEGLVIRQHVYRVRDARDAHLTRCFSAVAELVVFTGLERLQQLMDAMTDEGLVIRQHVYRVRDARDAHLTVNRHRVVDWRLNDAVKHILVDLPTSQSEEFLKLQV